MSVAIENTGKRAGDEVVQLYVRHLDSAVERPREDLRGYRRITLQPGETRTVEFSLPAGAVSVDVTAVEACESAETADTVFGLM